MRKMVQCMARAAGLASVLAAGSAAAWSVGTPEYTEFLPVWIEGDAPGHPAPALLNLPPGWRAGDAAVVLARGEDAPEGLRYRLTAELIDAGAAVLEVYVHPGEERGLPRLMTGALTSMRVGFGAGLVVAVGAGPTAQAVLGAAGGGYNGAAALEGGVMRVVAGAAPGLSEGWSSRAPMLCGMIAGAMELSAGGFVQGCARELAGR